MKILGVNAYHGDAAAALVIDGKLVAASAEERFNRKKHCAGFPRLAIESCLRQAGICLSDIDHVGISRKPWANLHRKFWHVISNGLWRRGNAWNSAHSTASVGGVGGTFATAWPGEVSNHTRFHYIEHHLAHAASAFYVSKFERAAILTLDGFGDFSSGLLGIGEGRHIKVLRRIHFPHSMGVYYTALTQYLGFPHYGDEGKVMALASFGKPRFLSEMKKLMWFDTNELIQLGLEYFNHHTAGVSMTWGDGSPSVGTLFTDALTKLLGPARTKGDELDARLYDVAASMQLHMEEVMLELASHLSRVTGETRLCLAGGVALNSVANGRIRLETPFRELFIQPAAADDGTAIGAAFEIEHGIFDRPRRFVMEHANLGPSFSDGQIETAIQKAGLKSKLHNNVEAAAAQAISSGNVIGWFQGAMEFGPRALGNRSILADPRRPDMKKVLNERVKHRETFRPFAPSLLEECASTYFDQDYPSPYMLLVYRVKPDQASQIAGALHIDQTGRLQTVTEIQNPRYHRLLTELKKATGHGVTINTSFNDSEPIVCTPEDAIHCFLNTKMDVLFLGNYEVMRP